MLKNASGDAFFFIELSWNFTQKKPGKNSGTIFL